MLNVFLISSDKRIERLIQLFQPFFRTKIRHASDFDNGLKEIFENIPTVVFIQSTIGTVSGETVSRHIKSLLGTDSPRIVFMGDIESQNKMGTNWCDDWIRIGESEHQLQQDFAGIISRHFPKEWQEICLEMEKTAYCSAETSPKAACFDADFSDTPILLQEEVDECKVVQDDGVDTISKPNQGSVSGPDSPTSTSDTVQQELPNHHLPHETPFLANASMPSQRRFFRLLSAVLLLLAVAGGGYFWTLRGSDIKFPLAVLSSPDGAKQDFPAPQPKTIKGSIEGLPSFIRNEWRDLPYTSQHPGWERYISPEIDFRIFREENLIKAFQGISLEQNGISEAFLDRVLAHFNLNGALPPGKIDSKNGFLIKNIVFPGMAELVTYRDRDSAGIKAFVLEFSW